MASEIQEYKFKSFNKVEDTSSNVKEFSFEDLKDVAIGGEADLKQSSNQLRIERDFAEKNDFVISPVVKSHRGITAQEIKDRERLIEEEVEKRVNKIKDEAFSQGHRDGVESGREEVFNQTRVLTEEKIDNLTTMIHEALLEREKLLTKQKDDIYRLINVLTKWIIMRELKDDGKYIYRLFEKLIRELQVKNNLLVQVNFNQFEQMPEVLEFTKEKLGEISNVRLEIDYDISDKGIVVESENGIINGTIEEQFKSLDKLFSNVVDNVSE